MSGASATNHWLRAFLIVGTFIVLVGGLYAARSVLVPVVLAVLLTFIFGPMVGWLQRHGLGRITSVLIVCGVAFAFLGLLLFIVFLQMKSLAMALPEYKQEITQKLLQVREALNGSWLDEVSEAFKDVSGKIKESEPDVTPKAPADPIPVTVTPSAWSWLNSAGPALDVLVSAGLVVILVMFMLMRREDLRNRLIRLSGDGNLTRMTKALDDVAAGISRFLLMQLIINGTYGLVLGLGLFALGVPYSVLWGFLAAVLRYIPYLGPWIGAIFPITISVAVMPGWGTPLLVLGLIVVIELISNNFMEPLLYGHSLGISEVSLLVSAAFWAWLWGPVGLVLATPLTVCLAVLGRFVPSLSFLAILLEDEVKLPAHAAYYQRLLAKDQDEALALVEAHWTEHGPVEVFDQMILPALARTAQNQKSDILAETDAAYIFRATGEWLDDMESDRAFKSAAAHGEDTRKAARRETIFGWAADSNAAQLGVRMLRYLLAEDGIDLEIVTPAFSGDELMTRIDEEQMGGICLAVVAPGPLAPLRYLCKRLRARFSDLKICASVWGGADEQDRVAAMLTAAGADRVATTLSQSRAQALQALASYSDPASEQTHDPASAGKVCSA